jgi:glycosyltransferase involved in cell wall biosynthesis
MRVAVVFGKGIDGCGVTRGIVEMQAWAERTGQAQVEVFSLAERVYCRSGYHRWVRKPEEFTPDQCAEVAARLDRDYDVVILNSYPSRLHSPQAVASFYRDLVCRVNRPILVGMMHEIKRMNIDNIPLVLPILNRCDVVPNFSERTWFAENFVRLMPWKTRGVRSRRFRLWIESQPLVDAYRTPAAGRARRLVYYGRWTTMKDPRRLVNLWPLLTERDPGFQVAMHGLEKSYGMRVDIYDQPGVRFAYTFRDGYQWERGGLPVFGQCKHDHGMTRLGESMFGSSFLRLPKEPENYGDRMEYTQIEMCLVGCVPVFDSHYGAHNLTSDGRPYDTVDHLAIWSDREDLPATADRIIEVANSPTEVERYREAGLSHVRSEFEADVVLPELLQHYASVGKDTSRPEDDALLGLLCGPTGYRRMCEMMDTGMLPAVGFKEAEMGLIAHYEGKARIPDEPDVVPDDEPSDLGAFFS